MRPPHVIKNAFQQWAIRAFEAEVSAGFSRAQTFDGPLSKIVVTALRDFSPETLWVLARVLPTGAASTGPTGKDIYGKLPPNQKQAVGEFQEAVQLVKQAGWQELSEHIALMRQKKTLDAAKNLRKVGLETIKEMAAKYRYRTEKLERAVCSVSSEKSWGKLSALFDFESAMELHYGIFVYDSSGTPLRQNDHYLGVLGVGPSAWSIGSADECRDKVLKASEFVHWHIAEYEKLIATL